MKIIENPQEIKEAQDKFLEILYQNADETITTDKIRIGLSGEFEVKAYWSNSLGFWILNREIEGNRYFNAFGIEKPDDTIVNAICEINFEKDSITRRTAGAFAKDLEGNVYIIHRGSVGGKKKEEFFDKYPGKTAQIEDGDAEIHAVVIGSLNDPKLPEYVRDFVFEVGRIKGLISVKKIWKIAPGNFEKRHKLWPVLVERGYIGVGWFGCESFIRKSYSQFQTFEKLREELLKCANTPVVGTNAKMIWNFGKEIQIGDIVVANDGLKGIWGIGIIKSDYIPPNESNKLNIDEDNEYFHFREVDWIITEPIVLEKDYFFAQQTITPIKSDKWEQIKSTYIKKDPKYADIFNQIENGESHESINIKENLELIFNKFPIAKSKNETVTGHEVGEAFKNISKAFYKVAKSIHPEKEYNSRAYYQDKGNWFKSPYIYIENKAHKDIFGHWDQHFVGFWFNEDLQGVTLCLSQSEGYAKSYLKYRKYPSKKVKYPSKKELQTYIKDHYNYVKNELKDLNVREDLFFDSEIDNMSDRRIYGKYYDKNNLPSNEEIISDFKDLFYLYSKLLPDHGKYRKADFKIIEDKMEIKESQNKLESLFNLNAQKNNDISYSSDLGIWMSSGQNPNSFYNLFGVGKPNLNSPNETTIEINFPFKGINRNISGAFARDDSGNTFLLHRGNLGGKFGGKSLLEENYEGKWADVEDGGTINKFILIGALDEPDFPEKLKDFVFEVCKIKKGAECVENQNFFDYLSEKGYLFDQKLVENFLLSLKVKPFVILTGNSGTGKTKVAQLFAEYLAQNSESQTKGDLGDIIWKKVDISTKSKKNRGGWELTDNDLNKLKDYSDNLTLEVHRGRSTSPKKGKGYIKNNKLYYAEKTPFYQEMEGIIGGSRATIQLISKEYVESPDNIKIHEIIPVGANWTENRHLVGFYNVITEKYQKTPTLDLILKSAPESNDLQPHFLILDEMNLSHVERYFSDFLSVMESQEEMPLHNNNDNEVPQKLKLPDNLLVIGTVNVDETTYMFSPKVLDRANTIEFLTLEPLDYMLNTFNTIKPTGDLDYLQDTLSNIDIRTSPIENLKSLMANIKTEDNKPLWDVVSEEINKIYRELKKAGFDFGFRVINEIMRFMYVAWKYEGEPLKWDNWERYFDAQIKQKMLPKLHGSQRTLQGVINNLFEICYGHEINETPRLLSEKELINAKYPTAALKLSEMDKVLYEQRYVAFIN